MQSLWLDTAPAITSDTFVPGNSYDTVVVGAGLTGLTAALLLARQGQRVAVLEARKTGAVTTGNTTAKISLLQGTVISSVARHHNTGTAAAYVDANRRGQEWLLRFCTEAGVHYEVRDAWTYAVTEAGASSLAEERDACLAAGLPVQSMTETELPFAVRAALKLPGQAQFHPLEALAALAREIRQHTGVIVEGVRVTEVHHTPEGKVRVDTADGSIEAGTVVLATGIPILDRGGYFAVVKPLRSYAAAFPVTGEVPTGMYLSVDQPARSLRTASVDGTQYLVSGGNGHPVGRASHTRDRVTDLFRWTQEHFNVAEARYDWSAQDYGPASAVPYVGELPLLGKNIYAATGFNKWGMTNAVAAALSLAAKILGEPDPSQDLYKAKISVPDAMSTVKDNAEVGLQMISGWAGGLARTADSVPSEGLGVVVREGGTPVAVCTVNGVTTRRSAICPHLHGILNWNDAEASWDCPLHGSRFTATGEVLEGPAVRGLDPA
ncbi:FAD-dependent oxidoreductase [Arthrobacter caoxuetaonis]|uniref:FAD-dependent oxidoreductase n=1 Tax=Arthrobacter caoxuetaonis TaxID=2886935 RepID=UPI001D13B4E4|nr:FAD-dependent oxidoreductase [Arthrobacter caoxuetaonis]MCC3281746.1 FAD-dependent oxidoreductase [Arthrobacter caoxuetaonis]